MIAVGVRGYLAALLLQAVNAGAQDTTAAPPRVEIHVVVDSNAQARVIERYRVPPDSAGHQLQLLERRCVTVKGVLLSRGPSTVQLNSEKKGPWTFLHDTTRVSSDASEFEVIYPVSGKGGTIDVPLVHLRRDIPQRSGEREGGVTVVVVTGGRVTFPRMSEADSSDLWTGRFVAIPSFIRVELGGAAQGGTAPCAEIGGVEATDGGLTWRFWTLLGIMVAWVPLYLAWAGRGRDGAEG